MIKLSVYYYIWLNAPHQDSYHKKQKKKFVNLHELYDRQAKWSMSDDVVHDENKVPLLVDDGHQELNDDDVQQPLLHMHLHMDHMMMY